MANYGDRTRKLEVSERWITVRYEGRDYRPFDALTAEQKEKARAIVKDDPTTRLFAIDDGNVIALGAYLFPGLKA